MLCECVCASHCSRVTACAVSSQLAAIRADVANTIESLDSDASARHVATQKAMEARHSLELETLRK